MHARIVEETDGLDGVRDPGLLVAACERPKSSFGSKQLYRTIFSKATALLESLARNHVFLDGNKRTAFAAAALFLHKNGYELSVGNKKIVKFMLAAAVGDTELSDIARWLKQHCRKF